MGKETIDTNTYGKTSGLKGNYSTNYQITGRELLTPDEVRMIDNKKCLIFIRGERPIIDLKFDIKKHPNINFTPDGTGENYYHGTTNESIGEVNISLIDENTEFNEIEKITGKKIIHTIQDAEPIGPKQMTDIMIVAPCSRKHYVKTCL